MEQDWVYTMPKPMLKCWMEKYGAHRKKVGDQRFILRYPIIRFRPSGMIKSIWSIDLLNTLTNYIGSN